MKVFIVFEHDFNGEYIFTSIVATCATAEKAQEIINSQPGYHYVTYTYEEYTVLE